MRNTLRFAHYGLTAAIASLACAEPTFPPAGVFRIVVSTIGPATDVDPDGYVLSMNDGHLRQVGVESVVRIAYVQRGIHVLRLAGLTENCAVVGDNPRSVMMPADDPFNANLRVDFTVECVPSGELRVTTATTGVDVDGDGYQLVVEGAGSSMSIVVPANGTVTVPRLLPGAHLVRLDGIEPNCSALTPNPRSVSIGVGSVATVAVELTCAELPKLAFVDTEKGNTDIFVTNSKGIGTVRVTTHAGLDVDPAWSPDGSRIAFASNRDGNFEVYVMNADGTGPVRLTSTTADESAPAWSPDGNRIAFVSHRDGKPAIYSMAPDGTRPVRLTADDGNDAHEPAWSPDGSRIAFWSTRAGKAKIYLIKADGSGVVERSFEGIDDRQPAWSPDGSRIAFTRTTSGSRHAIFTMKDDGSDVTPVTDASDIAQDPAWSADGTIAFVLRSCSDFYWYYGDGCLLNVASVRPGPPPHARAFITNGRAAALSPAWRP